MKGTYSIDIDRSREDVFAYLSDDANLYDMVPNLADHGIIEETPEKVGTTFWHEYEENGRRMKMTGVVTEHRPPVTMAIEMDGPMFGLVVRYDLEELDTDKTRLTQFSDARFKHVFKLIGLLFGKKMEREGKQAQADNFARMKAAIEALPAE